MELCKRLHHWIGSCPTGRCFHISIGSTQSTLPSSSYITVPCERIAPLGFASPSNNQIRHFHSDDDLLEALTAPDYPWDDMHHRSFFLPQDAFPTTPSQCTLEAKDFIPRGQIDWFKHPIPAPDAFEEGTWLIFRPQ